MSKKKYVMGAYFRFEEGGKSYAFITGGLKFRAGKWYMIATNEKSFSVPVLFDRYAYIPEERLESLQTITLARQAEPRRKIETKTNPFIQKVWFNDVKGSTIVEFSDGDKVEVNTDNIDTYDRATGIAWALLKKTCGSGAAMRTALKNLGAFEED